MLPPAAAAVAAVAPWGCEAARWAAAAAFAASLSAMPSSALAPSTAACACSTSNCAAGTNLSEFFMPCADLRSAWASASSAFLVASAVRIATTLAGSVLPPAAAPCLGLLVLTPAVRRHLAKFLNAFSSATD